MPWLDHEQAIECVNLVLFSRSESISVCKFHLIFLSCKRRMIKTSPLRSHNRNLDTYAIRTPSWWSIVSEHQMAGQLSIWLHSFQQSDAVIITSSETLPQYLRDAIRFQQQSLPHHGRWLWHWSRNCTKDRIPRRQTGPFRHQQRWPR